jgi:uncharacterized protein
MFKYFWLSITFTLLCLGLAGWWGWSQSATLAGVLAVLWITLVLGVLEVSLSFDNAVVNASVLKTMSPFWRQAFLTVGILIAVFGMRIVFPLLIVMVAAGLGPGEAVSLALRSPEEYERIITAAHVGIAGFGGAFLAMVGLTFFFDSDKDVHWIGVVERRLTRFADVKSIEIGLVLLALVGIAALLPATEAFTFVIAGVWGLLAFVTVKGLSDLIEAGRDGITAAGQAGFAAFLYLEILDASFSFDGVIGAFAITNDLVIIALGLGIGAMFVRSMTIMLVEKGTLAEYRYLEHGAFWAIIALAAIMLASARWHVPEVITGLIGAVLIGLSLWWSVRHNRLHPEPDEVVDDAPAAAATAAPAH